MITYNYFGNEQKLYYEKLENGLEIFLLPNRCIDAYHIDIVTRYGSDIKEFIPLGEKEYLKLPLGVAHFLEHKLFDMPDSNPFEFYAKSGSFINAGTNYNSTRYYVDGKKMFKKNLDYLIKMVFTPYFQEESINNEKKIISEEIKMYDDEADWILDYETKKCLYHSYYQDKIAGTTDSILAINADILKRTYQTFYQPSNMFIVITGNVPIKETFNIIRNHASIKKIRKKNEIQVKKLHEDKSVVKEYYSFHENVVIPKLNYSFKFDLNDFQFTNKLLLKNYLNIIFSCLFGEASSFNEKVFDEKLATDFYIDHTSIDNIYSLSIDAESEYADLFKDAVDYELSHINISANDFQRIKKVFTSIVIRSLDNINALASTIVVSALKEENDFEQLEILNKLNYDDLQKVIKELDFTNHSFVLMLPKE